MFQKNNRKDMLISEAAMGLLKKMEKDIGKIRKNESTEVVVRIDDFGGKRGVTIREYVTGEKYTGFTKSGTRIPAENFLEFRELVNKVSLNDLNAKSSEEEAEKSEEGTEENTEEQEDIEDY